MGGSRSRTGFFKRAGREFLRVADEVAPLSRSPISYWIHLEVHSGRRIERRASPLRIAIGWPISDLRRIMWPFGVWQSGCFSMRRDPPRKHLEGNRGETKIKTLKTAILSVGAVAVLGA